MKIAVVGCGAVGSYYGAHFARAGHDVSFLLRSDYTVVRDKGVSIESPLGNFIAHPRPARTPEEIGVCDLVVIGLKTTANDQFPHLLPPLAGPRTIVLTLQNGLGNEEALARLFPVEQIMGGLCFVCLNRIAPGVIRHMDHGLVVVGEFQRPPQPRTHQIAELFRNSGIQCRVTDDLGRAHWEKLVWNVPFNGLGVAAIAGLEAFAGGSPTVRRPTAPQCLTTDRLLANSEWEGLVRALMLEVIGAANAIGYAIPQSLADTQIERTRTMGAYRASTLIDFEQGRPLELEGLFLEPLRQARLAGAETPKMERLCKVLTQLSGEGAAG